MDPRIDRLRGLLAIGVLLGHAIDLALTRDGQGLLPGLAGFARPYFGFICVVGFIVLSGYCITRSTLTRFSPVDYAMRRMTRLYPLLIVIAIPTAILEFAIVGSPHRPMMWQSNIDWSTFLYALAGWSGFLGAFASLAPAYTISYELMYYAIWGLALTIARGRPQLGWLFALTLAALLLAYGDLIRLALRGYAGFAPPVGIALLPAWLLGAGLALYQRPLTRVMHWIPTLCLWIALGWAFAAGVDSFEKPRLGPIDWTDVSYYTAFSALLVLTLASWLSRPATAHASDTWLGELSYPLFLAHGPVIIGAFSAMNLVGLRVSFEATLLLLIAAAYSVASLLTIYVERPLMAWRRRKRSAATSPASSQTYDIDVRGTATP